MLSNKMENMGGQLWRHKDKKDFVFFVVADAENCILESWNERKQNNNKKMYGKRTLTGYGCYQIFC